MSSEKSTRQLRLDFEQQALASSNKNWSKVNFFLQGNFMWKDLHLTVLVKDDIFTPPGGHHSHVYFLMDRIVFSVVQTLLCEKNNKRYIEWLAD